MVFIQKKIRNDHKHILATQSEECPHALSGNDTVQATERSPGQIIGSRLRRAVSGGSKTERERSGLKTHTAHTWWRPSEYTVQASWRAVGDEQMEVF